MSNIAKGIAIAAIASTISVCFSAEENMKRAKRDFVSTETKNLIQNADFANAFKGYYLTSKHSFSIDKLDGKNILVIKSDANPEINKYLKCSKKINVPLKSIVKKKFTFGVTLKVAKVSGSAYFAIREVDGQGKTIVYHSIKLKKRDKFDWKKLTKKFTTSSNTASLALYIVEKYWGSDDEIQAKDIFLHADE